MFNGLVLFCTVISAFAGTVESKPWKGIAKPIKAFADHQVFALGANGDQLYVGSFLTKKKTSGFEIYDIKTGKMKEMGSRIHLNPQDSISQILVDSKTKHVWIATNNNLGSARCYDEDWMIMKCERAFLDQHVDFLKDMATKDMGSLQTGVADDDGSGGVVGEFKGGIYLVKPPKVLEKVYAPKNPYQWPVSSALTKDLALVGTQGDGLIVVNRSTKNVERHPDHYPLDFAAAIAVDGDRVFIGGLGLYQTPLAALAVK